MVLRSLLMLFLAQVCVGINIVVAKGLVNHINPWLILTIRFTLASIFMTVLLFKSKDTNRFNLALNKTDWLVLIAKALGAGVLFNFLILSGLHYTDANSAGLITSLLPVVVIGLNVLLFKQRLTNKMLISIVISLIGLILINWGVGGHNGAQALLGNFLVLLALLPDALYYVLSKFHPVKLHPWLKILLLNAINLPILYFVIFVSLDWSNSIVNITRHDWLMMGIIGINSVLFFALWQTGIQKIDAAYAALSTAFMPLATVILAWFILDEGLTVAKSIGMVLIILSIINYSIKYSRQ